MKSVYYKHLIVERMGFSAAERIVLSQLVYLSLCDIDGIWDKEDGRFDFCELENYPNNFPLPGYMYDSHSNFAYGNKISKATNVSQTIVAKAIRKLILEEKEIKHYNIYDNGYFELQVESGLRGELLIFYSWLKDTFKKNIIFCNRKKIAEMYHVEMKDIRDYISRLKSLGFVERDNDDNLIIKK